MASPSPPGKPPALPDTRVISCGANSEQIGRFLRRAGKAIVTLTVKEILDE